MALKMQRSSGNVFADVGFGPDEAEHLRIRSELMIAVRKVIASRELTQVQAAKLFGVTQPRISNLARGRIDLFSIDTLVDMLATAGVSVRLSIVAGHKSPNPRMQPPSAHSMRLRCRRARS